MIISILDTAFQGAKDAAFSYASSPIWEFNYNDSPDKPYILFNTDQPTHWKTTDQKSGLEKQFVIAQLFFIKYHPVADLQVARTVIVDDMHDAFKEFIKAFRNNSTINPQNFEIDIDSANNWLDVNYCGISVVLKFESFDMPC